MFESAQDCILIVNARTGKLEDANPSLLNLLGYSRSELVGMKVWQLQVRADAAKQKF